MVCKYTKQQISNQIVNKILRNVIVVDDFLNKKLSGLFIIKKVICSTYIHKASLDYFF